jgi:hypothetical protein
MHKLLSADPTRLGRPDVPPCSDAVDEGLVGGTPDELKTDLVEILGEDVVRHRVSDLVRYASDASPYRYIPKLIVQPRSIDDVAGIFRYCIRKGRRATFRAGGTSLNGQSQSDDILIDVRQHWSGWNVEDNGSRIRCHVGTTLGRINEVLKSYNRRMGPDPASINAATIGGVLANNAGGMRCQPAIDSYHSIVAMKVVLTTGTTIDTEDPHAGFEASESPALLTRISPLDGIFMRNHLPRIGDPNPASPAARQTLKLALIFACCLALQACQSHKSNITPTIEFTRVPPAAEGGRDRMGPIAGRVAGARPGQQIVLYARSGPWWVQPRVETPFTPIQPDSTWSADLLARMRRLGISRPIAQEGTDVLARAPGDVQI